VKRLKPEELRARLFAYLVRYNQDYNFSQLENAFMLISKSIVDQATLTSEEKTLIENELEFGMYEYFISLNHISEALSIIFKNITLDAIMVHEAINHVWEAYSCNEQEFVTRESSYLSENL
jgi:hypothetical protein